MYTILTIDKRIVLKMPRISTIWSDVGDTSHVGRDKTRDNVTLIYIANIEAMHSKYIFIFTNFDPSLEK